VVPNDCYQHFSGLTVLNECTRFEVLAVVSTAVTQCSLVYGNSFIKLYGVTSRETII
jgi:hypothetical protein